MLRYLMIGIFCFVVSIPLFCQQEDKGFSSLAEIKAWSQSFADKFNKENVSNGFEIMREHWIFSQDELDQLQEQTPQQLATAEGRYGAWLDARLAKVEDIPDLLYKLTYIIRHEKHGLVMSIYFYKGKNDLWYLNNFSWDDGLSGLLPDKK